MTAASSPDPTSPLELLTPVELHMLAHCGGSGWASSLPGVVEELTQLWGLTHVRPTAGGVNALVLWARRGEQDCVVKLATSLERAGHEALALRAFPPGVGPALLATSGLGLLMERLRPGTQLASRTPVEYADLLEAAHLLARLHVNPPPSHAPMLREGWRTLLGDPNLPAEEVGHAGTLLASLSTQLPVQLHGDAHLGNILLTHAGMQLVDPSWVAGDASSDIARLCLLWHHLLPGTADERITILCEELGYDPRSAMVWARLMAWAHVWYLRTSLSPERNAIEALRTYARSPLG